MSSEEELDRPRKKKKKKKPVTRPVARAQSYAYGFFLILLGIAMLVGYHYVERAPSKFFLLLAGAGAAVLLAGIGLFICPMDEEWLDTFQNDRNPFTFFQMSPLFWKIWIVVCLAAMIGGFIYVGQTTVRIR